MIEEQHVLQEYSDLNEDEPNIIRGATNADLDEIQRALSLNPDCINEVDNNIGVTALHIAAFDGNYDIVDFLCDQPGIDIAVFDKFGRTAYWAAHIIGRDDIVERIMRDTNARLKIMLEHDEDDNVTPFRPKPPSP